MIFYVFVKMGRRRNVVLAARAFWPIYHWILASPPMVSSMDRSIHFSFKTGFSHTAAFRFVMASCCSPTSSLVLWWMDQGGLALLSWIPTRQNPPPQFRMLLQDWTPLSPRSHGLGEYSARTILGRPATHRDRVHARRIESETRGLP